MNVGLILVDLFEFRHPVPDAPGEDNAKSASHLLFKRELRAEAIADIPGEEGASGSL